MTMLPKLNLPDYQPRWATDALRTLAPGESDKDQGWSDSDKPPARWMNWLQNLAYEWTRRFGASLVSNVKMNSSNIGGGNPLINVIFHPTLIDAGIWLCSTSSNVYNSLNGRNWSGSVRVLTAAGQARSRAIDATYAMFGLASGSIDYTSDGSSTWANDSGMTTTNAITALVSKYPDNNFLMLGDSVGNIEIAAGGIGTAWVAPTTAPTTLSNIRAISRVGSTSWIAIDAGGDCEISNDDGDTWVATASNPSSTGVVNTMAFNSDSGILVVAGETSFGSKVPAIDYSTDLGATWNAATIVDSAVFEALYCVYYCGGGIWYAHGELQSTARGNEAGYVSFDNGVTWRQASYIDDSFIAHDSAHDIGCDRRKLVIVREDSKSGHTLALPGSMNG